MNEEIPLYSALVGGEKRMWNRLQYIFTIYKALGDRLSNQLGVKSKQWIKIGR